MAERLHDDVERDRRIELVGKLFLETGYSTRNLSRLISSNTTSGFKISNATISTYINEYRNKHSDKAEQIDCLIDANKGSSIDNPSIIKRVSDVAQLILSGLTIDDICNKLHESYWVIYYDINIRLLKIDNNLYNEVKKKLEEK